MSVIMLVPLRLGLPDVSVIVQAIGQVTSSERQLLSTERDGRANECAHYGRRIRRSREAYQSSTM